MFVREQCMPSLLRLDECFLQDIMPTVWICRRRLKKVIGRGWIRAALAGFNQPFGFPESRGVNQCDVVEDLQAVAPPIRYRSALGDIFCRPPAQDVSH